MINHFFIKKKVKEIKNIITGDHADVHSRASTIFHNLSHTWSTWVLYPYQSYKAQSVFFQLLQAYPNFILFLQNMFMCKSNAVEAASGHTLNYLLKCHPITIIQIFHASKNIIVTRAHCQSRIISAAPFQCTWIVLSALLLIETALLFFSELKASTWRMVQFCFSSSMSISSSSPCPYQRTRTLIHKWPCKRYKLCSEQLLVG